MGNSCHKTSLKIRNQRLPIQKTLQHNNRLFSKRETQPRITHRVIVCYKNKKTVNVEYRLLDLLDRFVRKRFAQFRQVKQTNRLSIVFFETIRHFH